MKIKSCKSVQILLYLHRQGELSAKERTRLQQHLSSCTDCAAIAAQLGIMQNHIGKLAKTEPPVAAPDALTATIMSSVAAKERMKKYRRESIIRQALELLFNPRFRLSLASAIVLLVGFFIIQESVYMMRISALEKKMTYTATPKGDMIANIASLQNTFMQLEKTGILTQVEQDAAGPDDKQIEINKTILLALLENNRNLKNQNELLLKIVQQKNPDFYNTLNKLGLEQPEITRIMENKQQIVRLLNTL